MKNKEANKKNGFLENWKVWTILIVLAISIVGMKIFEEFAFEPETKQIIEASSKDTKIVTNAKLSTTKNEVAKTTSNSVQDNTNSMQTNNSTEKQKSTKENNNSQGVSNTKIDSSNKTTLKEDNKNASKTTQNNNNTKKTNSNSQSVTKNQSASNSTTNIDNNNLQMVWVGDTGTKYHIQSCRTLKGKGHQITKQQALAEGRQACKVCH